MPVTGPAFVLRLLYFVFASFFACFQPWNCTNWSINSGGNIELVCHWSQWESKWFLLVQLVSTGTSCLPTRTSFSPTGASCLPTATSCPPTGTSTSQLRLIGLNRKPVASQLIQHGIVGTNSQQLVCCWKTFMSHSTLWSWMTSEDVNAVRHSLIFFYFSFVFIHLFIFILFICPFVLHSLYFISYGRAPFLWIFTAPSIAAHA